MIDFLQLRKYMAFRFLKFLFKILSLTFTLTLVTRWFRVLFDLF